jgi:hypothetical protein
MYLYLESFVLMEISTIALLNIDLKLFCFYNYWTIAFN